MRERSRSWSLGPLRVRLTVQRSEYVARWEWWACWGIDDFLHLTWISRSYPPEIHRDVIRRSKPRRR